LIAVGIYHAELSPRPTTNDPDEKHHEEKRNIEETSELSKSYHRTPFMQPEAGMMTPQNNNSNIKSQPAKSQNKRSALDLP